MLAINTQKDNNHKKQRILVVDDEQDILLTLQLILEQNGFNVSLFDNPLAALSNFKIGLYDLAILDIKMPQMNGFQLYEKIKQIDRSTKVCFITAAVSEEIYQYDQFTEKKEEKEEENVRQISEQHQSLKQQYFCEATFLKKPISNGDLIREVNRILTS
jgi:CheY-like chemotaxis protein